MWTLSVCIPIYNSDVRALVNDLCFQIGELSISSINIVLIDDASDPIYRELNCFTDPFVRLIQLTQNIGRSKIRNTFLSQTDAKYLLFIDGDSTIQNKQFLKTYVDYLNQESVDVLVGASAYQQQKPKRSEYLRWNYSSHRESLNFQQRLHNHSAGFKTNNFLINREILKLIPFDERIKGYGHEDTLLGLQLEAHQIQIAHIDNPVWNFKLDSNSKFLSKTTQALQNLLWIEKNYPELPLRNTNRLLNIYRNMLDSKILKFIMPLSILFLPVFSNFLKSGLAPLFVFDLYRVFKIYQLDKNSLHDLR